MWWKPPVVCYPGTPDYQRYQWHTIDNGSFFALSLFSFLFFFSKKKMSENAGFEIERISKKVGCLSWKPIYPLAAERKLTIFFFLGRQEPPNIFKSSDDCFFFKKKGKCQPVPNVSNKHNVSKNIYSQGYLQLFLLRKGVFFFFNVWLVSDFPSESNDDDEISPYGFCSKVET